MVDSRFRELLADLSGASEAQKAILLEMLAGKDGGRMEVLTALASCSICPWCGSDRIGPWGSTGSLPRFRCRGCRRTFTRMSGTPVSNLRLRGKWADYAKCLLASKSIRASARECGISIPTAFLWRHRFLELIGGRKPVTMEGIVEIDETLFLNSKKGDRHLVRKPRKRGGKASKPGRSAEQVVVLVARERGGATTDHVLEKFNKDSVDKCLGTVLASDTLIFTDGAPVLESFAKGRKLLHWAIDTSFRGHVQFNSFHIQNVNAYHSRLKGWLKRFKGVSTRWLPSYLGWWRMMDGQDGQLTPSQILNYAITKTQQQVA